jgi:hypothetical protein
MNAISRFSSCEQSEDGRVLDRYFLLNGKYLTTLRKQRPRKDTPSATSR